MKIALVAAILFALASCTVIFPSDFACFPNACPKHVTHYSGHQKGDLRGYGPKR